MRLQQHCPNCGKLEQIDGHSLRIYSKSYEYTLTCTKCKDDYTIICKFKTGE